jgi:hypothetical protein
MKNCTKCGITKEYSQFHKYSRSRDGFKNICRACVKVYDQNEYDGKRKHDKKRQGNLIQCRRCQQYLEESAFGKRKTYCKACDNHLGHKKVLEMHGITPEQFIEMENKQNGLCKICGEPDPKTRLLLDHKGEELRGLLCGRCIKVLDFIDEDINLLEKIKSYLNKP